jgi:hypothetical protein
MLTASASSERPDTRITVTLTASEAAELYSGELLLGLDSALLRPIDVPLASIPAHARRPRPVFRLGRPHRDQPRARVRQLSRLRETPSGTRKMLDQVASHDVWAWQYHLAWLLGCEALQDALDGLPGDCCASVLPWAVEGCSLVEVGERLSVSEKVASARIRRACQQIRANAAVAA